MANARRKSRNVSYFVEPAGNLDNQLISNLLQQSEKSDFPGIVCADGVPHNLIALSPEALCYLLLSENDPRPRFKVWQQIGTEPITRVPKRKKKKRP